MTRPYVPWPPANVRRVIFSGPDGNGEMVVGESSVLRVSEGISMDAPIGARIIVHRTAERLGRRRTRETTLSRQIPNRDEVLIRNTPFSSRQWPRGSRPRSLRLQRSRPKVGVFS